MTSRLLSVPSGQTGAIDYVAPYTGSGITLEATGGIATSPGPSGSRLTVVVSPGTYVVDVTGCNGSTAGGDYLVTVIPGSHAVVTSAQSIAVMSALNGYLGGCSPGGASHGSSPIP